MSVQAPAPAAARPRPAVADTALVATGAALLCALGPLALPLAWVPITLQTLAVTLVGLLLGPVRGTLAVLVYLAVGAAGLPVFAEFSAGLPALTGVTAGYLWSFPLSAAVAGAGAVLVLRRTGPRWHLPLLAGVALVSAAVVFPAGLAWLRVSADLTWTETVAGGLTPFVPGGVLKAVVAAVVAAGVHRAFPRLLRR